MLRSGGSDRYYDSKSLKGYLEKVIKFSIRYDFPELREFVADSFSEKFWKDLDLIRVGSPFYLKYSKEVPHTYVCKYKYMLSQFLAS